MGGTKESTKRVENYSLDKKMEARTGFEPVDDGFANHSLNHLGTAPHKRTNKKASRRFICEFRA